MPLLRLAVVGDPHGAWDGTDHTVLERIQPDALLVGGDLSDGLPQVPSLLRRLELPAGLLGGSWQPWIFRL